MEEVVEAENLMFRYDGADAPALAGADLRVHKGEVYGLLGPNGAGKTTLLKLLATLLAPHHGRLSVLGHDLPGCEATVRASLGLAVGQFERSFHLRLTARQNLAYFAPFYRIKRGQRPSRIQEVLEVVGLAESGDRPYRALSHGMKHRLALARALLPRPDLLLLDEPFSGVDRGTARELVELLHRLAQDGISTVMATHDLHTAAEICDRVLILRDGQTIAEESPQALTRISSDIRPLSIQVAPSPRDDAVSRIGRVAGVEEIYTPERNLIRAHLAPGNGTVYKVIEAIRSQGLDIVSLDQERPSLEDVFLVLTGGAPP